MWVRPHSAFALTSGGPARSVPHDLDLLYYHQAGVFVRRKNALRLLEDVGFACDGPGVLRK